jgi:hypothetical protein
LRASGIKINWQTNYCFHTRLVRIDWQTNYCFHTCFVRIDWQTNYCFHSCFVRIDWQTNYCFHTCFVRIDWQANWPSGFGEEAWNVKSLQTTDDGRQVMAIVHLDQIHLDLWSRWTKNECRNSNLLVSQSLQNECGSSNLFVS